jgi:hypothetical protein
MKSAFVLLVALYCCIIGCVQVLGMDDEDLAARVFVYKVKFFFDCWLVNVLMKEYFCGHSGD